VEARATYRAGVCVRVTDLEDEASKLIFKMKAYKDVDDIKRLNRKSKVGNPAKRI
jgi:hypothetical protein